MSERSSRRELLVVAVVAALCACGKKGPKKPEADPAAVGKLAAKMLRELPTPAAVRDCTDADLAGGITVTGRSLTLLSGEKLASRPEDEAWINPPELDSPAVRALVDTKDKTSARQAAAEILAAPFLVMYKIDLVNAPMALGVKELKRGTVSTRVIRYEVRGDKSGLPACVLVFHFQNDQKISDDAIAVSEKAAIDPAVAKILKDDLTAQWIKQAPRGKPAAATQP
jgi:predicted small lipoprotein YifL